MSDEPSAEEPSSESGPAQPVLSPWWGEYHLPRGARGRWRIGPLELRVEHRGEGWDLAWRRSGDRRSEELLTECPVTDESEAASGPGSASQAQSEAAPDRRPCDDFSRRSVLLGEAHDSSKEHGLILTPLAADRPVVTRPDNGCLVLPGRSVTVYVSTPLWLRVESEEGETLLEEPTVRLSDTWFGPSTRVGELCYAIRTHAFPDLAELPVLAFRAITRLRIENTSHSELELIRLSLPAPNLSLWFDADHPERGLWTSYVVLRRSSDGETAEVDVVRGAPPELAKPERVSWPRQRQSRNVVVRAMSAILG